MSDQPAPPVDSPAAREAFSFFAATFAITWLLQLPALLAALHVIPGPMERYLAPAGLAAFGPLLGAVLVARRRPDGVRALFRPMRTWRVHPAWYPAALGASGAIFVAGMAVYSLFGPDAGPWFYPPDNAQRILAMVFFSVGEEVGWRGFALPRLQRRYGALRASLIVGLAWGLWHIPMFVMVGDSPLTMAALILLFMPAGSVVFTWFYNHTRGSLLIAILVHAGAHLNNSTRALSPTPVLVHAVAYCVVACALVLLDRKLFLSRTAADRPALASDGAWQGSGIPSWYSDLATRRDDRGP